MKRKILLLGTQEICNLRYIFEVELLQILYDNSVGALTTTLFSIYQCRESGEIRLRRLNQIFATQCCFQTSNVGPCKKTNVALLDSALSFYFNSFSLRLIFGEKIQLKVLFSCIFFFFFSYIP